MMRSLYSGVSGLTTHQTRMDVIGNNIANVNTYGFKASRVTFRDIYYQTAIGATSGRQTFAGNNPAQVGYGVQLGTIDKDMSVSSFQNTNYVFDLAIAGDGFFMTATFDSLGLSSDKTAATVKYTRMGNFGFDSYGNLVTGNNTLVVGSRNTLTGLRANNDRSLAQMNDVEFIDRNGDGRINAADVTFRNVINLTDLMQQAYNVYTDEFGYMYGYDWEALVADQGDPTGNDYVVYDMLAFGGTEDEWGALTDEEKMQYIDIQQTLMNLNEAVANGDEGALEYRFYVDKAGKWIADTSEDADEDGEPARISYTELYGALREAVGDKDATTEAKADAASAGALIGKLTFGDAEAVSVGKDGIITITYNSEMKSVARVDIAVFDNPNGLSEDGLTTFSETVASGEPKFKRPGIDPGVTETTVESKKLEMSNVNLAQEFSDMIVTQRGFQANARIITTSDSMLEELVNLKR